jgi:hypothetical protein
MKKYLLLLIIVIAAGCAGKKTSINSGRAYKAARNYIEKKDFFAAREYIPVNRNSLSAVHLLILEAEIDNAFNRPAASNYKIEKLFKEHSRQLTDSLRLDLLKLKQANHGRLFEYADAAVATDEIIRKHTGILSDYDSGDYKNTGRIWHALYKQPKQELVINGDTRMKMTRDKANLANLEVKAGKTSIGFIFDTGANISTVTKSTAEKFNMIMLDAVIEVGSITGAKVNSGLAVCPELKIGNIMVRNAVFLVFDDTALAFPQIDYQINGILGFPIIEAMKEVQITTDDEFIVPQKQSSYSEQNMALDFLNPVIQIEGDHYTFDTGATGTSLYKKYYEKHKTEIEANYKQTDLEFGGAGGMKTIKGYEIIFRPVINGRQLAIENVQLYTEKLGEKDSLYYGNIGQDVIKQFSKMTINFAVMFIKFD